MQDQGGHKVNRGSVVINRNVQYQKIQRSHEQPLQCAQYLGWSVQTL